ncbi:MAG: hypothetical protein ACREM2_06360 [Vulcanimicrobiaceae bacterium]
MPRFSITRLGSISIVYVFGSVADEQSFRFAQAMREAAGANEGQVVVVFVGRSFVGDCCVALLMRQYKRLGARLHIAASAESQTRRYLTHLPARSVPPLYERHHEAIAAACGSSGRALPKREIPDERAG